VSKRQFVALFVCSLIPWAVGNGLLPLLPGYAALLGAGPAASGYFLAFIQLTLTIGCVVAGWLSDRVQKRKALIIAAGALAALMTWLMGQATGFWWLVGFTAAAWFLAGIGVALLSTLTGLFAEEGQRGKVFGILGLTMALGSLLGSSTTGLIADQWGYQAMFRVMSLLCAILPIAGLFLEDKVLVRGPRGQASTADRSPGLGKVIAFLLLAQLVAGITTSVNFMGRSLAMAELGFAAAAVSTTVAIVQGVSLPLKPVAGWLSDRIGRKWLLAFSYVAGIGSLLVLTTAQSAWQFWLAAAMAGVGTAAGSVGDALVADLLPPESLGKGMSLYQATLFGAGIIGFAGTGHAVQSLGTAYTFMLGVVFRVAAMGLLLPILRAGRRAKASLSPLGEALPA
jgi:MFS family permease